MSMSRHLRAPAHGSGRRVASRAVRLGVLVAGGTGLVLALSTATALAGPGSGSYPQAYNPESAAGFTNTYTPPTDTLNPACPDGISGTPGSDPASVALNSALNGASNFVAGDEIHYVYADNPHGAAFDFAIQTCQVTYPASFFSPSDFDANGVLTGNFSKSDLDSNGTPIDGAELDGISDPSSNIYFSWTVPSGLAPGTWVCNFARDIDDDHSGGGNRKATPTCVQVNTVNTVTLCKVAGPNVNNGELFAFTESGAKSYANSQSIAAGDCATLSDVPFGDLTIKEKVPSPYEVQSIDVSPNSSVVKLHRTAGKSIVSVGPDPVTVTYTDERFLCSVTARGVNGSGLRFKTYSLTDPEGIAQAEGRKVSNATVDVAPFTVGTTDPVDVTVTRTINNTPGHAMIFEKNLSGVWHHCDPKV